MQQLEEVVLKEIGWQLRGKDDQKKDMIIKEKTGLLFSSCNDTNFSLHFSTVNLSEGSLHLNLGTLF